jgi:predicted dehydrogenase
MIRVCLIGCGRIGKRHAEILSQGKIEGAKLACVIDIVPKKCIDLGTKYDVPFIYADINDEVLGHRLYRIRPNLITLATPSGDHAKHIMRLIPFGIPILVEKPLALCLEDMDRIKTLLSYSSVPVGEVKQNRYNIAVQHLKNAILQDRLGKPLMASVRVLWARDERYYRDWHGQWAMAGGVLANQAIHYIDLLWWLLGDVEEVYAIPKYNSYTEVETGIVATLNFTNGCIGTIEATTLTRPKDLEGSLLILGEKGTVELGGFAANKIKTWQFETEIEENEEIRQAGENPPDIYGFGHIKMYEDVVRRLGNGDGMPVDINQARKSLEVCHAIYESMETGQPVKLGREYKNSRLGK